MPEMKSTEANAAHLHAETMTPLHSLPFATSADPRDLHAAQHTRPQSGTATAVARTVRHVWTHHGMCATRAAPGTAAMRMRQAMPTGTRASIAPSA